MNRWIPTVAAGLMLAAMQGLSAEPFPMSRAEIEAFGIRLADPEPIDGAISRPLPARVAVPNPQLRVVGAPQAGVIDRLLVATGESVTAGQRVAVLRSPALLELQRDFLEASAQFDLAADALERDRALHDEGIISERRWQSTRSAFIGAEATLGQHRQQLQLAGFDEAALADLLAGGSLTSRLDVKAPMDGIVLDQMGAAGQRVAAADPIYTVGRLDPLWLEIHVPLDLLADVVPDGPVAVPAYGIEGRVIHIGRTVHDADQGVLVRAEVPDPEGRLRPGQFVEATVCTDCAADGSGVRVPRTAVVREGGTAYVFERTDGGFDARAVTVLHEENDTLIISVEGAGASGTISALAISGTAALKSYWLQQQDEG